MELLSTVSRGPAPMGFYEDPVQRTPILRIQVAADVPLAKRTQLEVLRTDTPLFGKLIESRRNRRESWFHRPAGRIDVCNVPIPVRKITVASNPYP
jgi:peptidylprolyl isomerase